MHLLNLTLQKPTAISNSVLGNFTGSKQQELCVVRGTSIIEILHVEADTGAMSPLCSVNVFATVRSISTARLTGSLKDYLVVTSDSGFISILEYDVDSSSLRTVHNEPFGKSGCQRCIAGQYAAVDPKGRAIMIAAVESQRFVYVLNRDSENRLTISSPLEAHSPRYVNFALTALDVDFDNPVFACIEMECENSEVASKKKLTYYEVDLGLNLVVRKSSESIDDSSHLLISIPGGAVGPGGLLVCSDGVLMWKKGSHHESIQLPKRTSDSQSVIVVAYHVHCMKNFFFVFLQTELGDIFKLTFDGSKDTKMHLQYYDTISPSISLHVFKTGLLFAAAENGDSNMYQIQSLGGEDEDCIDLSAPESSFEPCASLVNITATEQISSINPCIQSQVLNLTKEELPQIYSVSGAGTYSTFNISKRGLKTDEIVSYPLPGAPTGIWSLKARSSDLYHSYIILSFSNATLVLSVGETVEEISDSGFKDDVMTLNCHQIGTSALLQIHGNGLVHVKDDGRLYEWSSGSKIITNSACNNRHVIIVLDDIEMVCFELNEMEDIVEIERRETFQSKITCLDLTPLPQGKLRSKFFAAGFLDSTVRIMSLNPDILFSSSGMQVLASVPVSIIFTECKEITSKSTSWYLNVGLESGVFMRVAVDTITGTVADARSKYIGIKAVKLARLQIHDTTAVLIMSSKTWLSYVKNSRHHVQPLSSSVLDLGSGFSSEFCPNGILGASRDTFQILTVETLEETMYTNSINLEFTPRQFLYEKRSECFIIIEGDHRALHDKYNLTGNTDSGFRGRKKASFGNWASLIRVLDPISGETKQVIKLEVQEMATCIANCTFHSDLDASYIAVAVSKNMDPRSRRAEQAFIVLYRISDNCRLEFVHRTQVDATIGAMCQFNGRLLIGMEKTLRIYDLGKSRLLRKSENNSLPRNVSGLRTQGDRIFISDSQESLMMARYIYQENAIVLFADDFLPRAMTCLAVLDYNTICGADKFGNIFVKRLSKADIDSVDEDVTGAKLMQDKQYLQGAGKKLESIAEFYIGDIVKSIEKISLGFGSTEVLFYSTLAGSMGMLVPLTTNEDVEFFSTVESLIRKQFASLCGRKHIAYRSYYFPVKCVVDGDLIDQFDNLSEKAQQSIAESMNRSISDITRHIDSLKERSA